MQKAIRINENQVLYLAAKARHESLFSLSGNLCKKSSDTGKWQPRFFALYQNLLFYYESDKAEKPAGVAFIEGCYCEKMVKFGTAQGFCFSIYYKRESQRQYDLKADSEQECNAWVDAIREASYARIMEHKDELEQKYLHILQILDSERQAKWHYVQQTEELDAEVKKLKSELKDFRMTRRSSNAFHNDSEELRKIKKVQSFFRGWLSRRRWKHIVEEYIRSEHAASMRKRNALVFGLVECEEEYVQQLSILVSCFLRPFRMAASSKKPFITHEDVNSIFLNAETVLFLHQIFLQGLHSKIENWPTLQLGDLFDMLLPTLGIYQEYVRNHHYSLQVLAEYKQKPEFSMWLKRYEEKCPCEGRSLESFLTYPMNQIPRYIVTLHELLAHTPHDHVDRKKLEYANSKLEELSHIMHDEVSETENIRKNLAIERMIVEGCDILLDVNQIFVRQGSLVQVITERPKSSLPRLGREKKELPRQVILFTGYLLITSRASNGRLHLAKNYGKLDLADCTLVEDTGADVLGFDDDDNPNNNGIDGKGERLDYNGLDFRIEVEGKSSQAMSIILVASTVQEKAAWCTDISQCIEQLHYSDLLNSSLAETSSVSMPQSIRSDPKLFKDDVDIKFSRTLNSCKVPQIRHATLERLLDRLTDLRFLSIDFLNTFLMTYRSFTTGEIVLGALKRVLACPDIGNVDIRPSVCSCSSNDVDTRQGSILSSQLNLTTAPNPTNLLSPVKENDPVLIKPQTEKIRRISTGMMRMEMTGVPSPSNPHSPDQQILASHHTSNSETSATQEGSSENSSIHTRRTGSLDCPNTPVSFTQTTMSPAMELNEDDETAVTSLQGTYAPIMFRYPSHVNHHDTRNPDSPPVIISITEDAAVPSGTDDAHPNDSSAFDENLLKENQTFKFIDSSQSDSSLSSNSNMLAYNTTQIHPATRLDPTPPGFGPVHASSGSQTLAAPGTLSPMDMSNWGIGKPSGSSGGGRITFGGGSKLATIASMSEDKGALYEEVDLRELSVAEKRQSSHSQVSERESLAPRPTSEILGPYDGMKTSQSYRAMAKLYSSAALKKSCENLRDDTDSIASLPTSPQKAMRTNVLARSGFVVPPVTIPPPDVSDAPVPTAHKAPPSPKRLISSPLLNLMRKAGPGSSSNSTDSNNSPSKSKHLSNQLSEPQGGATTSSGTGASHRVSVISAGMATPQVKQRQSVVSWSGASHAAPKHKRPSAISCPDSDSMALQRPSVTTLTSDGSPPSLSRSGAVITSSRVSRRRSSNTHAAQAFAAATAGSANPPGGRGGGGGGNFYATASEVRQQAAQNKRMQVLITAATMRVLNVVKHWMTKFPEDFDNDPALKSEVQVILEDLVCNENLVATEHRAAGHLLKLIMSEKLAESKPDLNAILTCSHIPSQNDMNSLSALDIAEQLTFLDHQIFCAIKKEELMNQRWMKPDKQALAPNALLVSKRFNEVSRLVVSEIVRRSNQSDRVACIEKWTAIANICKCLHNYNGVLQICAAFVNSSVYRLKRTWEKVPKQAKQHVESLQNLVSSDGRFKNMREALHRCDPPCIPYLGMYLTDLSFIEEGAPNLSDHRLINFCKLRMIAHVISEIQQYQQTPYRIVQKPRVTDYLLDPTRLLSDEETYQASLRIEPRQSLSRPSQSQILPSSTSATNASATFTSAGEL